GSERPHPRDDPGQKADFGDPARGPRRRHAVPARVGARQSAARDDDSEGDQQSHLHRGHAVGTSSPIMTDRAWRGMVPPEAQTCRLKLRMSITAKTRAKPKVACEISADRVLAGRLADQGKVVEACAVRELAPGSVVPDMTEANLLQPEAVR